MTNKSVRTISGYLPVLFLAGISCLLAACSSGKIVRVEIDPATPRVCDTTFHTPCGVTDTQVVNVLVWGEGKCDSVGLDPGAGVDVGHGVSAALYNGPVDFGQAGSTIPLKFTYSYTHAWPGLKTIHAFSAANCLGEARTTIQVLRKTNTNVHTRMTFPLAQPFFQGNGPAPGACTSLPDVLALRANTKVTVTANQDPSHKINFGCIGCTFGVNGEPNSSAVAPFPFVGKAKYSLVLKAGSQEVQGGSQVSFTTTHAAPLEICVNDDVLSDNTGAWELDISVDESQAP